MGWYRDMRSTVGGNSAREYEVGDLSFGIRDDRCQPLSAADCPDPCLGVNTSLKAMQVRNARGMENVDVCSCTTFGLGALCVPTLDLDTMCDVH